MSDLAAASDVFPIAPSAPAAATLEADVDHARRFGALERLYGPGTLERLRRMRIAVAGVGGVGSWCVEALARSAVGHLRLIDMDHVSESNINRQIQALGSTLGAAKVEVLARRIADINPYCQVETRDEFVEPDSVERLLGDQRFDLVLDATDAVRAKVALVLYCRAHAIPLVTIGAAGGQRDPARVRVADLAHTEHEPLLARVRKRLRSEHGFPRDPKKRFGVAAVFSEEPLSYPPDPVCAVEGRDEVDGAPRGAGAPLACAGFGSSVAVTATFGMVAAGAALNLLLERTP